MSLIVCKWLNLKHLQLKFPGVYNLHNFDGSVTLCTSVAALISWSTCAGTCVEISRADDWTNLHQCTSRIRGCTVSQGYKCTQGSFV
jgi:hypothetical protein